MSKIESVITEKYNNNPRVCIVSFPWASRVPSKFISEVLHIIDELSFQILVITGNTNRISYNSKKIKFFDIGISLHYQKDIKPKYYSVFLWFMKAFIVQCKTSIILLRQRDDYDLVIFYMSRPYNLLPILISKFLKKRTIQIITWSAPENNSMLNRIFMYQDRIAFSLLDRISPESKMLISNLDLDAYNYKISSEGARYVNTSIISKNCMKYEERDNMIGYIGRLQKDKGVKEFIDSIPIIVENCNRIKFLIGGDGDLYDWVKQETNQIKRKYGCEIITTGWIPENEFMNYLCNLKFLILPTKHAEGLPTIVLEAMAAGVPIISTRMGAIPDVIIDERTGFVLDDNSPEAIANKVLSVWDDPKINQIIINAKNTIAEKYTYSAAVKRYSEILKQ